MLDISRQEIEKYCFENNLQPNNDSSNLNNKYSRNYIRNKILPLFNQINPQAENSIYNLSILAFEEEEIIKEYINSLNLYDDNKLKSDKFINLSKNLQKRLIYELYVAFDFEYTQEKIENTLKFILDNIKSKSGKKCSITKNFWLFVNNKYIEIISNTEKCSTEIKITKEGSYNFNNYEFSIKKCEQQPSKYPKDSDYTAYIELNDEINFTLRTRQNGDRIQPLGSNTLTKLKKYFINKNIAQHKKDKIILLCKDSEVLWVSGYGISNKIKVVNKGTHVLTLKKIGGTTC